MTTSTYADLRARFAPLAAAANDESIPGTQRAAARRQLSYVMWKEWPAIDALLARGEAAEAQCERADRIHRELLAYAATLEVENVDIAEEFASAESQWGDNVLWQKWSLSEALNARRARLALRDPS